LFGPSQFLDFPDTLWLKLIGFCVAGISLSFIIIPILYEIILSVQIKESIEEDNNQLNDKAYRIYNITYAIGCGLSPIIGGALN
jgi:hypothetical protein